MHPFILIKSLFKNGFKLHQINSPGSKVACYEFLDRECPLPILQRLFVWLQRRPESARSRGHAAGPSSGLAARAQARRRHRAFLTPPSETEDRVPQVAVARKLIKATGPGRSQRHHHISPISRDSLWKEKETDRSSLINLSGKSSFRSWTGA